MNSPFWLILPLLLLREIRQRMYKQNQQIRQPNNDIFFKLKRGLTTQGFIVTSTILVCILGVSIDWLISHSIVMFNLIFLFGWISCMLQFIIFGGLKRQTFAHSAYYGEEKMGKTELTQSKYSELESKSKSVKIEQDLPSQSQIQYKQEFKQQNQSQMEQNQTQSTQAIEQNQTQPQSTQTQSTQAIEQNQTQPQSTQAIEQNQSQN